MEIIIGVALLVIISFLWALFSLNRALGKSKKRDIVSVQAAKKHHKNKEVVLFERNPRKH